jgi:NDP-sugar pyrophosphorylase family protein
MDAGLLSAQIWPGYWSDIGTAEQLRAVDDRLQRADAGPRGGR